MLGLDKQRKEFDIIISDVLRCHFDFDDFYNYLNKSGCAWFLAHHDKDIDENGEPKLHHIHLVLVFPKVKWCKTILNDLCDCLYTNVNNIWIDEVKCLPGAVQYLTHKNTPQKYQYDFSIIETNVSQKQLVSIYNEKVTIDIVTTQSLEQYIFEDKLTRRQLIEKIGVSYYEHYYKTIRDLYEIRQLDNRKAPKGA